MVAACFGKKQEQNMAYTIEGRELSDQLLFLFLKLEIGTEK